MAVIDNATIFTQIAIFHQNKVINCPCIAICASSKIEFVNQEKIRIFACLIGAVITWLQD